MKGECRICLTLIEEISSISVFVKLERGISVLQVIIDCAPIEIFHEDPLSKIVCHCCFEKLNSFYELRQLIIESDNKLKQRAIQETIKCESENNIDVYGIENEKNEIVHEESVFVDCLKVKSDNDKTNDLNSHIYPVLTNQYVDPGHNLDEKLSVNSENLKRSRTFKLYECKKCNKTFKNSGHYNAHMTNHTGEKKFACEFCPKKYSRNFVLVYHRRLHTGEKPYTCNICSKNFTSSSSFSRHKQVHKGERNYYKCKLCDKIYLRSTSLKTHLTMVHSRERPFLCEICSSTFKTYSSFVHHKKVVHKKIEKCLKCGKMYSQYALRKHIKQHQDREERRQHPCEICGKLFVSRDVLKHHQVIHTNKRPYSCKVCQKTFTQSGSLHTHMRVHSDKKPFECEYCPSAFKYKQHLQGHVVKNHKEVEKNKSEASCSNTVNTGK